MMERENAQFFEVAYQKLTAHWMFAELYGRLNKSGKSLMESPITPKRLAGLVALIENNTISGKIAKEVMDIMFETGDDALHIVESKGLRELTCAPAIEAEIERVLSANPNKVAEYKSGNEKLFGFFVGQVMEATGGKINPARLNDLLKAKLE